MRFSPKQFAVILSDFIPVTDTMVREWCEEGLIASFKNPGRQRGHYSIHKWDIPVFLRGTLNFPEAQIKAVMAKIGEDDQESVNFNLSPVLQIA